jgi:hypothetical protein
MPKIVDARVWSIVQRCRIDAEIIWRVLVRLAAETSEPSPDDLETYDRYWQMIATKLECEFGL